MIETDIQRREFADGEELAKGLATNGRRSIFAERSRCARGRVAHRLRWEVAGSVLLTYFQDLELDWTRVAITLADERRVADDSPRSNARLARERLLRNRAAAASFTPLADVRLPEDRELAAASARVANLPSPADVVVLGMGVSDRHTASWFPGAEGLAEAMDSRRLGEARRPNPCGKRGRTAPDPHGASDPARGGDCARDPRREAKLAAFAAALEPRPEEAMPIRAVLRGAADRHSLCS